MGRLYTEMRMRSTSTTPIGRPDDADFRIDDIATHEILEGLARLHSLVVVTDLDGRILWMSEAFGSACGGAGRLIGDHVSHAFAALPGARERAKIREQIVHIQTHLRSNENLCDIRLDLGTRDGLMRSVDLSAFRTETQAGTPIVVSIVHPSEGRPESDPALREERDMLAGILEASPDSALALDRFGFIVYANPAAAALVDVELERLVGSPIALLVPRSSELVSVLSDLRPGDLLENRQIEMQRSDGSGIHVSVSTHPHACGRGVERVVFLRDVTDQFAQRRSLERKNAELEAYVHSVSHDLRSPLVSLLGFTRLLRQDYGHLFDDTGRHFTDRIEQAAHTMESLIDDLLELSQIGVGREHPTLIDPRAVLLQLQAELKLRLDTAGARLLIPENPPLLLCDRTRLYQLFSNLVGNAMQHMGECEDRTIEVTIEREQDHDVLTIADHGQGIESSDLERIFDVFYSRNRSRSGTRSTGIGLAIVRKIAETHGGRAWAESEPGHGARFHVSLPRGN